MHDETLRAEFTHQAASFAASPAMTAPETLGVLLDLVPEDPSARWLDAACGPGLVACALAGRVGEVHGVDLTPAMAERARRTAAERGLANATFSVGDATALDLPAGSFDGAVSRFSLHHLPRPGRLVAELARVVRPGGHVMLADHVAEEEAGEAAWHEEVERLRDPSHWACLTPSRLRALGDAAGLRLEHERLVAFGLDFDDWLERGSGGRGARALIDDALAERPAGTKAFAIVPRAGRRELRLVLWLSRWAR